MEDDRIEHFHEVGRGLLAVHDREQAEDALGKVIYLDLVEKVGFAHRVHAEKLASQIIERLLAEE